MSEAIRFWKVKGEVYGFLSNFYGSIIEAFDLKWPTSEHLYQALKFYGVNMERFKYIAAAPGPRMAAAIGRSKELAIRPDWEEVKVDAMRYVVALKFFQSDDIKYKLIGTHDAELIEDSPFDSFWGCGADGNGMNMLGKILMEVRAKLKAGHILYYINQAWTSFTERHEVPHV